MNEEEKDMVEFITLKNETEYCTKDYVDYLLSLLNKLDKLYNKALTDLVKAEKVVNLIAESWKQDDVRSVEEIKEYFYKKVEELGWN